MGDLPRQIPPAPRSPPEAEGCTGQAGVRREKGLAAAEGDGNGLADWRISPPPPDRLQGLPGGGDKLSQCIHDALIPTYCSAHKVPQDAY